MMPRTLILLLAPILSWAQTPTALDQILERLNRLEQENRALRGEVAELRDQVRTLRGESVDPPASVQQLDERLSIQERRTDEQAQTKVEAVQRYPVKMSGMLLANLFHNGPFAGGNDHPTRAAAVAGRQTGGITFRQSIVGFQYIGGQTLMGGRVRGSVFLDFFEGPNETTNFYPVRVRTASVEVDWATRTLGFVMDKPLFSQRDPSSFSFQGVSPLTSSGNLWRWQPQVRMEQRWGSEDGTLARAQVALVQTAEESGFNLPSPRFSVSRRQPGLEGRFSLAHHFESGAKVDVAPGFHVSNSRIDSFGVRSSLVSVEWLAQPFEKLELTGLFWRGQNVHHFGSLRQSFRLVNGRPEAVRSQGGWGQAAIPFTPRWTFNLFGGAHDDRDSDLSAGGIGLNRTGAANIQYRLAPNVIVSLEALQTRTTILGQGLRKNNRYDLGVAYLF
ncbi:MAG: hypothetical protein R2762_09610 [Bryobacteraceae bacterium]